MKTMFDKDLDYQAIHLTVAKCNTPKEIGFSWDWTINSTTHKERSCSSDEEIN